jgi:hypothetical protein
LLLLGACKAVESPVRVTTFTVNAAVPTLTTGPNPIAAASAEVLVGQTGGGGWSTYGRAAVPASSFGSSVPVAGTLGCGSSIACTVVVRVRLLDASGVPFDSADTPAFTLAGGDTRTASGFEFRAVQRLVFLDTAIVLPMGVGRTMAVAVLDNADRPLVGRPLTFTSSDPSIVTVNAAGQVVGVRGGRAVVTAARESRTARVAVTVNMLQQFSLSAAAPNVMRTLTVRVIPTLQVAPGVSQRVRYTSSDSSVAIVDSTGLVTGRAEGTVTISAAPDADPTQVRSVSITVDPYRAASQYRYVNVMVRPEPSFSINGAWALQGNNVIVAGCGGIARWNGATWRYETNIGPCANAVTGTGDNNVYVLGPQSWRYNGTAWARESYTPPREILGAVTVENVIYAVGRDGYPASDRRCVWFHTVGRGRWRCGAPLRRHGVADGVACRRIVQRVHRRARACRQRCHARLQRTRVGRQHPALGRQDVRTHGGAVARPDEHHCRRGRAGVRRGLEQRGLAVGGQSLGERRRARERHRFPRRLCRCGWCDALRR